MNTRTLIPYMLVILFCCTGQFLYGQTDKPKKRKTYKAWVVKEHKNPKKGSVNFYEKERGYLNELADTFLIIKEYPNISEQAVIPIADIKKIKFRRKGNIAKGTLLGALGGFASGFLIGLSMGDHEGYCDLICFTGPQKGIILGTLLTIPGAIAGGIAGSLRVNIDINGSQKKYNAQKEALLKYQLLY